MSGMPKIIKTLTGVGTAIGVVVIIVGNAIIATSRGGSPVGLALRSLGLLLALIALGTFLCVSVGSRIYRDIMRRRAVANKASQQPAMETMMNQNLSAIPADPPTPPLVMLGRGCAILLLVPSAITVLVSCVRLVQVSAWGWPLLYVLGQSSTATILLLATALLLWIAAEALNKSAQNRQLLILLLQQREATGPGAATTHGSSLSVDSNSEPPTEKGQST